MIEASKRLQSARAALFGLALLPPTLAQADAPDPATLTVRLTRVRAQSGWIGCTLHDRAHGFPEDADAVAQRIWCPIDGGTASCRFAPTPPGRHAVACFHDEDGDGELDTNLLGIPREGVVVSRHAKGRLGPPSFDDAAFTLASGSSNLSLRMSY
jgi:uncharacterized protein (DUF2141 family)